MDAKPRLRGLWVWLGAALAVFVIVYLVSIAGDLLFVIAWKLSVKQIPAAPTTTTFPSPVPAASTPSQPVPVPAAEGEAEASPSAGKVQGAEAAGTSEGSTDPSKTRSAVRQVQTIEGFVVDENGEPVGDAHVELRQPVIAADGEGRYTMNSFVRTGEDGGFQVGQHSEPVEYELRVFAEGFLTAEPLRVRPGMTGLRVVLRRGGAVSGIIRTEDGSPLDIVVAVEFQGRSPKGKQEYVEISQDGTFRVSGLPPDEYEVRTYARGWLKVRTLLVKVRGEEELGPIELVLRRGGAVAGRVLAPDGLEPLASAQLRIVPFEASSAAEDSILSGHLSGETGLDGRFLVRGLEPGAVRVRIAHPDATTRILDGVASRNGEVTDLGDIVLAPACVLSGTVRSERMRGLPAEGVTIAAFAPPADTGGGFPPLPWTFGAEALSDGTGRYRLVGLPPGVWWICASRRMLSGSYAMYGSSRGFNALRGRRVELVEGDSQELDFTGSGGPILTGMLLGPDGPGSAGEATLLFLRPGTNWTDGFAATVCGPAGDFVVEDIPPGEYVVQALTQGSQEPLKTWMIEVRDDIQHQHIELSIPAARAAESAAPAGPK